jgi:hypothetical protein
MNNQILINYSEFKQIWKPFLKFDNHFEYLNLDKEAKSIKNPFD